MRISGWFRLWVVLTVIGVPAATVWQFHQQAVWWERQDQLTVKTCVDAEFSSPSRPDAVECAKRAGAYQPIFQREHTTPLRYWSMGLGFMFIADLILTGIIVAAALAIRWVIGGFRPAT